MIKYWNKSERFEGELFKGTEKIGDCKFVFHWNRQNTKEMKVEIFVADDKIYGLDRFTDSNIFIECNYGENLKYNFDLNIELFSSHSNMRESVLYIPVNRFSKVNRIENDRPKKLFSSLSFPLIKTTDTTGGVINHPSYGYVYGDFDKDSKTIDLNKKILELQSSIGTLVIEDNFISLASKQSDDHVKFFPGVVLLKESKLFWEKEIKSVEELENSKKAFLYKAEEILSLLSISERDRIDWHHVSFETINENNRMSVFEIEDRYQYSGHPTDKLGANNFRFIQLQEFLAKALKAYESLSNKRQNEIMQLSRNFQIANLAKTFEDSFIRWHSCLDFLRKKFGKGGYNISKEILGVFEDQEIEIDDIFDADILSEIRSNKSKFPFTDLRNKYVHSGFDVFSGQFQHALNQRRIMRALAERLLMKRMDIDFRDTHLGNVDV